MVSNAALKSHYVVVSWCSIIQFIYFRDITDNTFSDDSGINRKVAVGKSCHNPQVR